MSKELNREIAELLGWTHDDADKCGLDLPFNPKFDSDPRAAFVLLEHVLKLEFGSEQFHLTDMFQGPEAWYVELCLDYASGNLKIESTGEAVTLPEAIATACRDALKAVREREGKS